LHIITTKNTSTKLGNTEEKLAKQQRKSTKKASKHRKGKTTGKEYKENYPRY
jgi:hypothetical protein